MQIRSLEVRDVRNLAELQLEIAPGLNLFQGPNGSGKTALLESIYLLARGRSFRTSRLSEVVRYEQPGFQVVAQVHHGQDGDVVTGIARQGADLSLRYAGRPVTQMSSHACQFPLSLSTPASQDLVYGPPRVRRKWLDWGLFHVEQAYLQDWRDYHRALRQRNCLLKKPAHSKELGAFEANMSAFSEKMLLARERFAQRLSFHLSHLASQVCEWPASVALDAGWSRGQSLAEVLRESRSRDAESGHTRSGPHRADLLLMTGDRDATVLSRGQSKFLVVLLAVALGRVIEELGGEAPILLLDDPLAELDREAQCSLLDLVARQGFQALVSLPDADMARPIDGANVFHVKRGLIGKNDRMI